MARRSFLLAPRLVLFTLLLLALLPAAQPSASRADPDTEDVTSANARLRAIVAKGSLTELRWPDFHDYQIQLREFYEPTGYATAWIQGNQASSQAFAMIELFKNAWKKGLEPEDYDAARWDDRVHALKATGNDPAMFDAALTVCVMRLISDLRIGRINPKHLNFGLNVEQKKYDLAQFLRDRLLPANDLSGVLDQVEPPFSAYRRTESALARYIDLARRDDGEQLPAVRKPIEPGQPYSGVPRLYRVLSLVGDFSESDRPTTDNHLYAGALVEAVKHFQRRHGLDDDGRLGPETLKQLNVPLSSRVRQLQLALERWRWLPSDFPSPPIIVNIPDFRLRALDKNNNVVLNMRVVVGKAMRTQTPVFTREMTHVVLRPYWNVPPSILRGEIIPAIQRNRDYVATKGFEVTTNDGRVVTSAAISDEVLSQLKARKLSVRQKPGPTNALGLVKLMFPNEFNVYLHSTPAREAFSRSRRDFSHGCIRVEKPAELTEWALRNNSGWSLERVQKSMQTGSDNQAVTLTQPIPVFIVYATALAYDNGEVHFYNDIYGHDARLAEALAKGYPYP